MAAATTEPSQTPRCDLCFEQLPLEGGRGGTVVWSWVTVRQLVLELCGDCNRALLDSMIARERDWTDTAGGPGF